MRGDAGFLAMRADRDRYAAPGQLGGFAGAVVVLVVTFRGDLAAGVGGGQDRGGLVTAEQRVLPDLGMGAPVGIARRAAIGHHQGRGVTRLRLAEELQHVLVEHAERQVVLNRGVAIGDQGHVEPEERSALGHRAHPFGQSRRRDLLALVAARLVVVLQAVCALGLETADMGQGVLITVDLGVDARLAGAIDDLGGREGARAQDLAGAHHFQRREDRAGAARGIVPGGHPQRQVDHFRPVGLGRDLVDSVGSVGVGVDQARDHGLAPGVERRRSRRDRHLAAPAYGLDPVALDQHNAIVDDAAIYALHGDHPRADNREAALGLVCGDPHRERNTPLGRLEGRGLGTLGQRGVGEQAGPVGAEHRGAKRPVQALAALAPVDPVGAVAADPHDRQGATLGGERDVLATGDHRGDEGLVVLAEGQEPAIRRDAVIVDEFTLGMDAARLAIEVEADQAALLGIAFHHEDTVIGGPELGIAARVSDAGHLAAGCRHTVHARFGRATRAGKIATAVLLEDHDLPIGREARTGIMAGGGEG